MASGSRRACPWVKPQSRALWGFLWPFLFASQPGETCRYRYNEHHRPLCLFSLSTKQTNKNERKFNVECNANFTQLATAQRARAYARNINGSALNRSADAKVTFRARASRTQVAAHALGSGASPKRPARQPDRPGTPSAPSFAVSGDSARPDDRCRVARRFHRCAPLLLRRLAYLFDWAALVTSRGRIDGRPSGAAPGDGTEGFPVRATCAPIARSMPGLPGESARKRVENKTGDAATPRRHVRSRPLAQSLVRSG